VVLVEDLVDIEGVELAGTKRSTAAATRSTSSRRRASW
jgi:hypothetical protein